MDLPGSFPATPERHHRNSSPLPSLRVFSNGSTRGYGLTDEDIFIDSSPPTSPVSTKRREFTWDTPPDSAKRPRTRQSFKDELPQAHQKKRTGLELEGSPRKRVITHAQTQTPVHAGRTHNMPPTPPSTIVKKRPSQNSEAGSIKRVMRKISKSGALTPSADAQKRVIEDVDSASPKKRVMRSISKTEVLSPASPAPKRKSERLAAKSGAVQKKKKADGPVIIDNPNLSADLLRHFLIMRGRPLPEKLRKTKASSSGSSSNSTRESSMEAPSPAPLPHPNLRAKRLGKTLPKLSTLSTPLTPGTSASPSPTFSSASSSFSRKRKFSEVSDEDTVSQKNKRCCDIPSTDASTFGLLYEKYSRNPFRLTFIANFLAKGRGKNALVGLDKFLATYPTEMHMARANALILERAAWEVVGLYGVRGIDMCNFAKSWLHSPPRPGVKRNINIYEKGFDGKGWEIGHITGIGGHAIDVWRVFCRDDLLDVFEGMGTAEDGSTILVGYEWMTVKTDDPELKKFLKWKWKKLGIMEKKFAEVMKARRSSMA